MLLLRSVYIACGVILCLAMIFTLRMALSYDGKCGGFFPESVRRSCSLSQYLSGDVVAMAAVVVAAYWPALLILIILAVLAGYFLGRGARHGGAL